MILTFDPETLRPLYIHSLYIGTLWVKYKAECANGERTYKEWTRILHRILL